MLRWHANTRQRTCKDDPTLTAVVTALSNVVSNVPAVMLLKVPVSAIAEPAQKWLRLAMSTLAGNLTITGSVANRIVAEKVRGESPLDFWQYLKIGVPVTVLTLGFGLLWLTLVRY